ncbi:hypothetical protein ACIQFU_28490 [Streptomyces sp. NPDC093065]|uniref:hypothetical protein n=1 Tax=Streptomyces sp. NPDC093065 TaxID=3366021 RepID=UPI0037FB3645
MRPVPHAAAPVRSGRLGGCLRVLVLPLVAIVPGTHAAVRAAHRGGVRPTSTPPCAVRAEAAGARPRPGLPRGPRSVVLRC